MNVRMSKQFWSMKQYTFEIVVVVVKMRKLLLIGIAIIILAGIGVGLYFILKPKAEDPIAEHGVCCRKIETKHFRY